MPIIIAALIAMIFLAITTFVPDESGLVALVVIPLALMAIYGSAMTYSRLRAHGDEAAAVRFLGALAVTFVLFVAGAAGALALDATSIVFWVVIALVVVAPVAATTPINSHSRRTSGE